MDNAVYILVGVSKYGDIICSPYRDKKIADKECLRCNIEYNKDYINLLSDKPFNIITRYVK